MKTFFIIVLFLLFGAAETKINELDAENKKMKIELMELKQKVAVLESKNG